MIKLAETYLGIQADGTWTVKEGLLCAAAVVAALILVLLLLHLIQSLVLRAKRRKTAIFSNSKNRYKSRLGKKNIKY